MKGRASVEIRDAGSFNGSTKAEAARCEISAGFGDYGRAQFPTLSVDAEGMRFHFEFASPDEARKLGERLFELARKSEEKAELSAPAYREQLAREEFKREFQDILQRLETALDVKVDGLAQPGLHIFPRKMDINTA